MDVKEGLKAATSFHFKTDDCHATFLLQSREHLAQYNGTSKIDHRLVVFKGKKC